MLVLKENECFQLAKDRFFTSFRGGQIQSLPLRLLTNYYWGSLDLGLCQVTASYKMKTDTGWDRKCPAGVRRKNCVSGRREIGSEGILLLFIGCVVVVVDVVVVVVVVVVRGLRNGLIFENDTTEK